MPQKRVEEKQNKTKKLCSCFLFTNFFFFLLSLFLQFHDGIQSISSADGASLDRGTRKPLTVFSFLVYYCFWISFCTRRDSLSWLPVLAASYCLKLTTSFFFFLNRESRRKTPWQKGSGQQESLTTCYLKSALERMQLQEVQTQQFWRPGWKLWRANLLGRGNIDRRLRVTWNSFVVSQKSSW